MVRPRLHVLARKGIHYPRHGRLPRARIRPHRLLRGRYGTAALVDRATHRNGGAARHKAADAHHSSSRERQAMRRMRRAKIVATLGPASSNPQMIARLFEAGADVFRINMSHTSPDRMREIVGMIRSVERDTGRPIGILVDLQGPKLRLGTFQSGSVNVKSG